MCTGVIVITATIAAWEMTMATRASRARGTAPMTCTSGGPTVPSPCRPRDAAGQHEGVGPEADRDVDRARTKNTEANSQGPVYLPRPNHDWPACSVGPMSSGPRTAPKVDAKMTRLIARLRWSGSARSAAA